LKGHQVTILSTAPEPGDEETEGVRRLMYREADPGLLRGLHITPLHLFFQTVRKALPALGADIVHCYHFYDTLAATMPRRRPYRVVMQMNGVPVPGVSCRRCLPPEASLIRRAMRRADVRIACSQFVREMVQRHFGLDALVMAPPLDAGLWPVGGEPRNGPPVVLMAANFSDRRKGLRVMLEGFQRLRARIPDVQLWLSGTMPDEVRRQWIETLPAPVREAVRVLGLGRAEDLPALYQRANVLASPSMWEPSGTVMMESWLCGTPVVATRHGGLPEYFAEGVGYLFDAGTEGEEADNAEGLAEALALALEMGPEAEVRRRCRQHGESFTTACLGPRYEAVYRELCG